MVKEAEGSVLLPVTAGVTCGCIAAGGGQQVERVEAVVEEKGEQVTDEDESGSHSDESQAEEADTESHKDEKVRVVAFEVNLVVVVVMKDQDTLKSIFQQNRNFHPHFFFFNI